MLSKRKDFIREEYGDVFKYLEIRAIRLMYFLNMENERMSIIRGVIVL